MKSGKNCLAASKPSTVSRNRGQKGYRRGDRLAEGTITRICRSFHAGSFGIFDRILDRPEMFPVVHHNIRRALFQHFPYAAFFVVDRDMILIVGVIHHARHPHTWQRRSQ